MERIKRDRPASPEDDISSSGKRQRTDSPPAHDPGSGIRNGVQPGSLRAVSTRNETLDQVALQLTYAYTNEQIQTDPELRNLNKIKRQLDQALRIKKLDPTNVPAKVDSMRNYLSLPKVPGRVHRHSNTTPNKRDSNWTVQIVSEGTDSPLPTKAGNTQRPFGVPHAWCGGDDPASRRRAGIFARSLCDLLDRLPISFPEGRAQRLPTMLLRLARFSVSTDDKPAVPLPTFSTTQIRGGKAWYVLKISFINTKTGLDDSLNLNVYVISFRGVDTNDIPDLADTITLYKAIDNSDVPMVEVGGRKVLPRILKDGDNLRGFSQHEHDTTVKSAIWMSLLLNDTEGTSESIQKLANSYRLLVGSRTQGKKDHTNTSMIFVANRPVLFKPIQLPSKSLNTKPRIAQSLQKWDFAFERPGAGTRARKLPQQ